MRRTRTGRGDAAPQRAMKLGVCGRRLTRIRLAAAVHPDQPGVSHDGIDERDNGTAVSSEDVRDSGRNEGVTEKVGTCKG